MKSLVAIVDYRMSDDIRDELTKYGVLEFIDSYRNIHVHKAISGHVDISLFYDGNTLIASPESYDYYKKRISEVGLRVNLLRGETYLERDYPKDISYNVFCNDDVAIASFKNTDKKIKALLNEKRVEMIDVKQGYANCSILGVDNRSIITSDIGIFNTIKSKGLDVLLIENAHINLFDMDYGFIGGATSVFEEKIFFFGDVGRHPNFIEIEKFINDRGKRIISLGKGVLQDFGSMYLMELK